MRFPFAVLPLAVMAAWLPAGESAQRLALAQATELALARNQDLIAAGDGVAQALAGRVAAAELLNPTVSASLGKVDIPFNDPQHNGRVWSRTYDWIFQASQTIELGGKRGKRIRAAEFGVDAARAQAADVRRTVRATVARAYVAVLAAREDRRILDDSATSLEREAAIAGAREHAGDLAVVDRQQIEVAAAQRRLDAEQAVHDEGAARIALQILAGLPSADGWEPADDLAAVERALAAALPEHPDERPDVAAARIALAQADANRALARANAISDVTVGVQYEHNPPDQTARGDSLGLSLSVPVPLFSANEGAIAAADAGRVAAKHALAKARLQAESDLANARLDHAAAQARLVRYRSDIVPRAERAWEAVSFAFGEGAASMLDLLSAQRTLNDLRLAAVQATADAVNAGIVLRANCETIPVTKDPTP